MTTVSQDPLEVSSQNLRSVYVAEGHLATVGGATEDIGCLLQALDLITACSLYCLEVLQQEVTFFVEFVFLVCESLELSESSLHIPLGLDLVFLSLCLSSDLVFKSL